MEKVSAVIVSVGAKDYLTGLLDSLFSQSRPANEIIVIDNSLNPELAPRIKMLRPTVKVYSSQENLYYGRGLNKGIKLSNGEFILCLNDDIILDKNFILESLRAFSADNKVGMVAAKLMRKNEYLLDSAGLTLTFWRSAKDKGYGKKDAGNFDRDSFVFGVNGAAAFYRRKMLEDVKENDSYFDPRFKMFYEDLDLSWRARKKGWLAYYAPKARAYHVRGGSFRPDSGLNRPIARRYLDDSLHYELIKNRHLTILKNESAAGLALHLLPILIYDLAVFAYILLFRPGFLGFILARMKQKSRQESF